MSKIETRDDLINLLESLRIDSILEPEKSEFDQDELGKILFILGADGYGVYSDD